MIKLLEIIEEREWIRKNIYYHCSPVTNRKSIKKNGINSSLTTYQRWSSGQGFYIFDDLNNARWYANVFVHQEPIEPFDIWEIKNLNLKLIKIAVDPMNDGYINNDESPIAFYYPKQINNTHIRLKETIKP